MPSWLPIALTIVFGTLTIVMNAIINIKIKFVPSADVAKADLKQLALRVIQWISNLLTVGGLALNVFSSEPLTHMAVFTIALAVASLMFVTVMHFITRIYGDINTLNESVGTVSESITLTGQLSEIRLKEHELKSSLNGTPGTEGVG